MALVTEIFPDFTSALAACGPGYNNALIADVIAYKTALAVDPRQFVPEQALNSILAVGIAAADITERPLTVLDFGGGCGFHYFRVIAAMQSQLRWPIAPSSWPKDGSMFSLKLLRLRLRSTPFTSSMRRARSSMFPNR